MNIIEAERAEPLASLDDLVMPSLAAPAAPPKPDTDKPPARPEPKPDTGPNPFQPPPWAVPGEEPGPKA